MPVWPKKTQGLFLMFGLLWVNYVGSMWGKIQTCQTLFHSKLKQHGLTFENGKYTITWFCSQLPPSIMIINEVRMQLVTTDE